jgi:hypothetical protein
MKLLRYFVPATLIAVGISLLLAIVGEIDQNLLTSEGEPLHVFQFTEARMMTEATIVDDLTQLQLYSSIQRVSVNSTILEIDLKVNPQRINKEQIYHDLGELAKLAWIQSGNIQRVFIRVFTLNRTVGQQQKKTMLLALTGRRDDFTDDDKLLLKDERLSPALWIQRYMEMTYTDKW